MQADIRRKIEIGCYHGPGGTPRPAGARQRTRPMRHRKGPKRTIAGKKRPGTDATRIRRQQALPQEGRRPPQEKKNVPHWRCAHQEHVHHTIVRSPTAGQCHRLGVVGSRRLQGFA